MFTLEYEINVPVRLLICQIFSHRYTLISDGMFIEIWIIRNWNPNWNLLKDFYGTVEIFFMESNDRNRPIELQGVCNEALLRP